jgi:general secretion pathway protein D
LQTSGATKTLSAPSLVVLNNQQASITVGDQIPIQTTSIYGGSGVNGTNTTNNTIGTTNYVSTGSTLQITPRVNPGGLVYMDVSQEITKPPAGFDPSQGNPSISQRTMQTQIAVQSGQTVLLAGLIGENNNNNDNGVPLLSSIPIVGNLFKSTANHRDRTEIIVLITPIVIYNSEDARTITEEYQAKFESLARARAKIQARKTKAVPEEGQGAVATPIPPSALAEQAVSTEKPKR